MLRLGSSGWCTAASCLGPASARLSDEEEEEEESEEEDDAFGPKKKVEEEDAVTKAKKQAVEKMQDATNMVSSLFKF